MISLNVKSLFTNVPLDKTIDVISKKVYNEKEIQTNIPNSLKSSLGLARPRSWRTCNQHSTTSKLPLIKSNQCKTSRNTSKENTYKTEI